LGLTDDSKTKPSPSLNAIEIPIVVVSGLPASGKSTLSRKLAPALGLSLIDKDDILEGLFETIGVGDTDWRRRLSRASDSIVQRMARSSPGAVLTSFWRWPGMSDDSGTPIDWIAATSHRVVEVYCAIDPQLAATRFVSRPRHAGHLDQIKRYDEVVATFRALAAAGPLCIGSLLRVDTSGIVDSDAVTRDVRALLSSSFGETTP